MSGITTHILDVSRGRPAAAVLVTLENRVGPGEWNVLARGVTDADGRLRDLLREGQPLAAGDFRLTFDTGGYFDGLGVEAFYPQVQVQFTIRDPRQHYHVPLLLSPYGYSTYRGS